MSTRTTAEPQGSAPLLDLHALVVSVWRRRRLWTAAALLGLVLGTAVAVLLPPPPSAVTKVLVAHQGDQPNDPGTLIRTDVALLHTTRIADRALRALGSPQKPEEFMQEYGGIGLTNNLLQIDVTGATDAEAVARAKALAEAFVDDHVRRIQEAATAESKTLLAQRDRMRAELAEVNEGIGKGPEGSGPEASAAMEALFARRAELTSRIAEFDRRAAEARLGTPRLVAGTQIVDAPRAVAHSLPKAVVTHAVVGTVLGTALGLAVAAVATVVGDRPVLRRDIAAGLGSSVLAELPRRSGKPWRRGRTRAARERLTTTLARTVRGSAEPFSLLELGCSRGAAVIARDLGRALAEQGPVTLVDGLPDQRLGKLKAQGGDPPVITGTGPGDEPVEGHLVGVGSVAPGTAWTDLRHLGTRTVLVVRAGSGSAAWLHTVARQLADQRIPVVGVVLVDPDPLDRTDGTLWDGPTGPRYPREDDRAARHNGVVRPRTERLPVGTARVPDRDEEAR
ncbi:Wzz/FepE/Etk N-terminal domain-containing protein [Streptomyces sp. NPDC097619]|uniref:Wzz/FepE/Etk N-terminal domain-containing protein n=1 Tax=Streptomyces sp. NPDC097619 TaxID=3157228 RepID=UPI00331AF18A